MGVDWYLLSADQKAALYLDRAKPLAIEGGLPDLITPEVVVGQGTLASSVDDDDWREAVAHWVGAHGPCLLVPDNVIDEDLYAVNKASEKFEMLRYQSEGGRWVAWEVFPDENEDRAAPKATWVDFR